MEKEKLHELCRVCLLPGTQMVSLDSPLDLFTARNTDFTSIADVLETVMSVKLIQSSDHPNQLCSCCKKHLEISYNLHLLFHRSQDLLNNWPKETVIPKSEPKDKTESLQNSVESNADPSGFSWKEVVVIKKKKHKSATHIKNTKHRSSRPAKKSKKSDKATKKTKVVATKEPQAVCLANGEIQQNDVDCSNDTQAAINTQISMESNKTLPFPAGEYIGIVKLEPQIIDEKLIDNDCDAKVEIDYNNSDDATDDRGGSETEAEVGSRTDKCDSSEIRTYNCQSCGDELTFHKKLNQTRITCKNCRTRNIICPDCDFITDNRRKIFVHKNKHLGLRFKCDRCDKRYFLKEYLVAHKVSHEEKKDTFLCTICGKNFVSRNGLMIHMKWHNNEERKFCCTYCGQKFRVHSHLKRHERRHAGIKPYKCSQCDTSFFSSSERKRHETLHHGKPEDYLIYECNYCAKRFYRKYHRQIHHMSHAGSHVCQHCSRTFVEKEFLNIHLNTKHKELIP